VPRRVGRRYQREALRIDVLSSAAELARASSGEAGQVEQRFYRVSEAQRIPALGRWLALERPVSALIFCNTRSECTQVAEYLRGAGWVAASIQGDMAQRERQHAMRLFANGSCTLLVATDVAARGWDIPDLPLVINLGLSRDPTVHLHRVGRTGRLGKAGLVVNFVSKQDVHARENIERQAAHSGFEGRLVILAEPGIATGDCRIEWADGGVVLERAAIEAKINELVGRYMASRDQAGRP